MDDNNLIIEILVKYSLRRRLSRKERAILERWRAESEGNHVLMERFRDLRWVQEQRRQLHAAPSVEMWEDIRQHIDQSGEPAPVQVMPMEQRPRRWPVVAAVAAGVIGLVVVSVPGRLFVSKKGHADVASTVTVSKAVKARAAPPPSQYRVLLQRSEGRCLGLDDLRRGDTVWLGGGYALRRLDSIHFQCVAAAGGGAAESVELSEQVFTGNKG